MTKKVSPGQPLSNSPIRSASFLNGLVDVEAAYRNGQIANTQGSQLRLPDANMATIRNDTGAALDLGAIVHLGDYLLNEENPKEKWYEGLAVNTTFTRRYAIVARPIPQNKFGPVYVSGMCPVRYTGSAPSQGDGMGPKPSQATAEVGYPSFITVDDVVDTTEKLLLGTLSPITTLLCKATADLSEGPVSSNFKIWSGTVASGADSGFTSLPEIEITADISNGDYFLVHWTNNGWVGGASGTGGANDEITVVTDYQYDATSHALQKKTRAVKVTFIDGEAESGWTEVHPMVQAEGVSDITFTGYSIEVTPQTWYTFEDPEIGSPETLVDLDYKTLIVDVFMDGLSLFKTEMAAYVINADDPSNDTVFTGIECDNAASPATAVPLAADEAVALQSWDAAQALANHPSFTFYQPPGQI